MRQNWVHLGLAWIWCHFFLICSREVFEICWNGSYRLPGKRRHFRQISRTSRERTNLKKVCWNIFLPTYGWSWGTFVIGYSPKYNDATYSNVHILSYVIFSSTYYRLLNKKYMYFFNICYLQLFRIHTTVITSQENI